MVPWAVWEKYEKSIGEGEGGVLITDSGLTVEVEEILTHHHLEGSERCNFRIISFLKIEWP